MVSYTFGFMRSCLICQTAISLRNVFLCRYTLYCHIWYLCCFCEIRVPWLTHWNPWLEPSRLGCFLDVTTVRSYAVRTALVDAFLSCSCYTFDPAIPLLGIYKKQTITHFTIFSLLLNCPRGRRYLVYLSTSGQCKWDSELWCSRFCTLVFLKFTFLWNVSFETLKKSILKSEASALLWLFKALCYRSLKSWIIIQRVSGLTSSWVHVKSGVR